MPKYSKESLEILKTVHVDLSTLMNEVIKIFDNKIVYGHRSTELQFKLFKKGRTLINNKWVITNKSAVVTYMDGITNKSNHNYSPSNAIDTIPYPVDWTDTKRMYYFAGWVMSIAKRLKEEGLMTHDIRWLGDQDMDTEVMDQNFFDLAHYEIILN